MRLEQSFSIELFWSYVTSKISSGWVWFEWSFRPCINIFLPETLKMYLIIPTIVVLVLQSPLHLTIYIVFCTCYIPFFCCPQDHWATDTHGRYHCPVAISGSTVYQILFFAHTAQTLFTQIQEADVGLTDTKQEAIS